MYALVSRHILTSDISIALVLTRYVALHQVLSDIERFNALTRHSSALPVKSRNTIYLCNMFAFNGITNVNFLSSGTLLLNLEGLRSNDVHLTEGDTTLVAHDDLKGLLEGDK